MKTMKKILLVIVALCATASTIAQTTMSIDARLRGPLLSPWQWGLFFEEINHAGDGGLYAELIRNRSFEDDINPTSTTVPEYWVEVGGAEARVTTNEPMNSAQRQALLLTTTGASASQMQGVANRGFWNMHFQADSIYRLSLWVRPLTEGFEGALVAQLQSTDGATIYGEARIEGAMPVGQWTRLSATIRATQSVNRGRFALLTSCNGEIMMDVVSLFPPTWRGRENGLRPDLAQLLCDLHPAFLRFPGGCFVEGTGSLDNAFQWKNTIGPIHLRGGHQNVNWGYRSSDGLGFDEYLQLCEDLQAEPMFVVNVGLGHGYTVPLADVDTLVQNALDAIEYANGDATTTWGRRRIENGHAAPYGLRFVEIGNENYQARASEQSQQYAERYYKFYKAIKEKYPDIITIGNVEAWGTDNPSWRNTYPVEMVDEHYYRSYSWMLGNYRKYDHYSRSIGIYNGEYAANEAGTYGQYGNMNSALGEAVYMLGMERNSDVCRMASFAPIFMHESDSRWPYDMIHFNCYNSFVTPSYHVQRMMATNRGHQNLLWTEKGNTTATSTKTGIGTWSTSASFDDFAVTAPSGAMLASDDFGGNLTAWTNGNGRWTLNSGMLKQTLLADNCTTINKTNIDEQDFDLNIKARKDGGAEGFLIIFNYTDNQNYAWWNIGGWGNTQHAIERCKGGAKQTLTTAQGSIATGQWYDLRVEVRGQRVRCFIDDQLIHDISMPATQALYQSVQLNEDEDLMIVKLVNPNAESQQVDIHLDNMKTTRHAMLTTLAASSGTTENSMVRRENVKPTEPQDITLGDASDFCLTVPPFSLCIYRIDVEDVMPELPRAEQEQQLKEQAATGNAVDLTPLLHNADFSHAADEWQGNDFTNANGYVVEHWNKTFDTYQTLEDMPAGVYEFRVQAFYRAGDIEPAYKAYTQQAAGSNAELYANEDATSISNLYSAQRYKYAPYTFPDNMASADAAFNIDGQYGNTLRFHFQGGQMRLGIRSRQSITHDWCCFDNFQLFYLGSEAAIHQPTSTTTASSTVYDLQGRRIATQQPSHNAQPRILVGKGRKWMAK